MNGPAPKQFPDSIGPTGTRQLDSLDDRTVTTTSASALSAAAATTQQDFSGTSFSAYQLVRKIAEGGMGVVYEAVQTKLDRRVALKILSAQLAARPEFLLRFEREAKAAAALNHPNIVQVHDFLEVEGRHCLILEFVDGEDLGSYASREGKLPLAQALDVVEQAARGLQVACAKAIIHRDIKPSNLMLTRDGRVKISDLGLAKIMTEDSDLTLTNAALGSPHFMAPEQASDAGNVDHRADIYALGITLLYLVTGRRPYDGTTPYSVVLGHANKPLPSGAELGTALPAPLETLIQNMAAKRPANRYQDYDSLLADLKLVKAGLTPSVQARSPRLWKKPALAGAMTVLALVGLLAAGWLISGHSRGQNDNLGMGESQGPMASGQPIRRPEGLPPGGAGFAERNPPPFGDPDRPPLEGERLPMEPGAFRLPMGRPPDPEFYSLPEGPVDSMLAAVETYAEQHPQDYRGILDGYDRVRRKAAGSPREQEIDTKIKQVVQAQQKAVTDTLHQFESQMQEKLRAGKPQEAYNVWKTFPGNLRSRETDDQIRYILRRSLPPEFSAGPERR
jgi:serine/threonine protein kinase